MIVWPNPGIGVGGTGKVEVGKSLMVNLDSVANPKPSLTDVNDANQVFVLGKVLYGVGFLDDDNLAAIR